MRLLILSGLLLLPAPVLAKPDTSLEPLSTIPGFLPYGARSPVPVEPDNPYFRNVYMGRVSSMPDKVGAFLVRFATRDEMDAALSATLRRFNMLAEEGTNSKYRFDVQWVSIDAPQKISFSSHATVTMRYALRRIADGKVLFARDITTTHETRGGDGDSRIEGNARIAISTNIASAIACLDEDRRGQAPADCALSPNFKYYPRQSKIMFVPSFR